MFVDDEEVGKMLKWHQLLAMERITPMKKTHKGWALASCKLQAWGFDFSG